MSRAVDADISQRFVLHRHRLSVVERLKLLRSTIAIVAASVLVSCGAPGEEATDPDPGPGPVAGPGSPSSPPEGLALPTEEEAARFLTAATFGPTREDIDHLTGVGYSTWVEEQLSKPLVLYTENLTPDEFTYANGLNVWWDRAVAGEDQLRQRMAFALSQIFVVSASDPELRNHARNGMVRYMDIIQEGAFGNYRDLLEAVTYSPAMARWLTYLGNQRADRFGDPDENYAREVMQLFSIGVVELNADGTPKLDASGQEIETYTNEDVVGLARVFTGLWFQGRDFRRDAKTVTPAEGLLPLAMNDEFHSKEEKSFLGVTIPENTPGETSIDMALDRLAGHANVAPFISQQLIQRLVTSNPTPDYVERVATTFESGRFTLPNGSVVGSGRRGDLSAVAAAIVLDSEALNPANASDPTFGKLREPTITVAHWARNADVSDTDILAPPRFSPFLESFRWHQLSHQPFFAPSVFNFYRPQHVARGSETGSAGLLAPELQIVSTNTVAPRTNFLVGRAIDGPEGAPGFGPTYRELTQLAGDPAALIDEIDLVLMRGNMRDITRMRMEEAHSIVTAENGPPENMVRAVMAIAVTAPEFVAQY